jgi:hypothetical protein
MSFTVKRSIFAHDLNPPADGRSCDIDLKPINASGAITLAKEAVGIQTRYLLTISDPSLIGLRSPDRAVVDRAVRDLVLSFNLVLTRACLSILPLGDLQSTEIELQPPRAKVTIEQTPEGKRVQIVEIVEPVLVRPTVHITIRIHDEVDEKQALANLEKIIRINRFGSQPTSDLKVANLTKALNEYESAMLTLDRLRIFRSLFNTLEFCTNWDGKNRTGSELDSVIASVSGVGESSVGEWRRLYNRTKHVDREPAEASKLVQEIEKLPSFLPPLREAVKRLIVDRLSRI